MAKKQKKQEALSVSRLINEVLVAQLSIPFRQIVNDTTFSKYTGSKRPDILISEFEYDGTNDEQYIKNLVAYAEAKDDCKVGDKDWKDALKQGKIKAPKLGLPYFIVTNCKTTYFYNAKTLKQLTLNGNPIREFQTIDIYRLIKNKLTANPDLDSINTNVDSISTISEAIFNKKLWELAGVYRGINFKDNVQKIDFTVGFVALEYFEEKEEIDGTKDATKVYWSTCNDNVAEKVKNNLSGYISRLEDETTFKEFKNVMEVVRIAISGDGKNKPLIGVDDVKQIYKMSGNSGLTEEFIYHAMQNKGEKYTVLSSATEDRTKMGEIPMCTINNKPLKVFEGQEGLLVTRNGKAGHTRYLPFGRYTINDHAYILFVKEDAPYAVDLRWLAIQYRTEFLQFASSSDNGTWNMTGFFKQVKIDIPDIEEQKPLVDIYDKLTYVQDVLSNLDFSVSKLFDKQVIVDESV